MSLKDYFENNKGYGVLATADAAGKVNVAVYARPHFLDEHTVIFIMGEKLTHENLQVNPWAAYSFIKAGDGWTGKRLYLKKLWEEQNEELRRDPSCCGLFPLRGKNRFLVYLRWKGIALIGDGETI